MVFLLNGCVESIALLGSSVGGASSGRVIQSSLNSTISYGIKKQTGKTPLGHAIAYAEKNNPEKKKETCISFIEKTRSEFCAIAKKKISLTNSAIKEKVLTTVKTKTKIVKSAVAETKIKFNIKTFLKELNSTYGFNQSKKSPRDLAIAFQAELKKQPENKYSKKHLVSR